MIYSSDHQDLFGGLCGWCRNVIADCDTENMRQLESILSFMILGRYIVAFSCRKYGLDVLEDTEITNLLSVYTPVI